jgi:MFS family permease
MKRPVLLRATSVVLLMLCLMYFLTYLDRVNVSSAAEGFGKEFSLNKTQIGFVFSAFAYPYLVFQVIGGWVSDRFGAKRTLIFCGAMWGVATFLTGMSVGLYSMLAARLLLGLGEGATFPAATSAMSRWVRSDLRGFAQGLTHAFSRIGNSAAPMVIALIMAAWGWREAFYFSGALSILWVIGWALLFTEDPADHPGVSPKELAALPPPKKKNAAVPWMPLARRMWPVTLVYFCYGWTLWLYLSWIPQYFLHSYHLDLKSSAGFATGVFFAGVVGDTLGGIVSDRILKKSGSLKRARSQMVAVCLLLSLVSLSPIVFNHDLTISICSLSIAFFFAEMTIGAMWAIPMDIAPEYSGTASGMMNIGSALAAIISPVASGYLIDRFGNWELPFFGSMLLMALGAVLAYRMHPEHKFEAQAGPVEVKPCPN